MSDTPENVQDPAAPKPTGPEATPAADFSRGFHIGCGVHAMAIIIILLLTLASEWFFWLLLTLGALQLIYMLPSAALLKHLDMGPHVRRGFWGSGLLLVILNLLAAGLLYFIRQKIGH